MPAALVVKQTVSIVATSDQRHNLMAGQQLGALMALLQLASKEVPTPRRSGDLGVELQFAVDLTYGRPVQS